MAKYSFGMSSWDEEVGGNKRGGGDFGGGKKDVYMRLNDGPNRLRLLTRPFQYNTHKYKEEGDPGYGDKILCSRQKQADGTFSACPLCARGDKSKERWFVGVIDRKGNEYKLLDIGPLVYQGVQTLSRDEDWGDPSQYDVDIKVNKSAPAAGYYTVTPKNKTPLSEADLKLKAEKVDEAHLLRKCTPPTPEWTLTRVNTIREKQGKEPFVMLPNGEANAKTAGAGVANNTVAVPVDRTQASGDDEDDMTFPARKS